MYIIAWLIAGASWALVIGTLVLTARRTKDKYERQKHIEAELKRLEEEWNRWYS